MIALEKVSKWRGSGSDATQVLNEISVRFEPGVNVGILAKPGAGKTTLLSLLAKATTPDAGRIMHYMSVSWPISTKIGLINSHTPRDNIRFACRLYDVKAPEIIRWVDRFVGLGSYLDEDINSLPAGLKQKFTFALSVGLHFDYYLWDDVVLMGDDAFRAMSTDILRERQKSSTFIIATSSPKLLRDFCDIYYILNAGQLIRYGELDEALGAYNRL